MMKIAAVFQPEIEVFVNGNGQIAIHQDECEEIGNHTEQLIIIDPSNAQRFCQLVLQALDEVKIIAEDDE